MRQRLLTMLLAAPLLAGPAAAVTIVLDPRPTYLISLAGEAGSTYEYPFYYPTTLPDVGQHVASVGTSTSAMEYRLSDAGFMLSFDHVYDLTLNSIAQSIGSIGFTPSSDVDYSLSGAYASNSTEAGLISLNVSLFEFSATIFQTFQQSISTSMESFTAGQLGGDQQNLLIGSLTGTLLAGHTYVLYVDAWSAPYPDAATEPGDASGYVTFAFIPEPGTGMLVMIGLFGLAAQGRRRV
jgi:hypothetical protein